MSYKADTIDGTDLGPDDEVGWNGHVNVKNWKIVGRKEMPRKWGPDGSLSVKMPTEVMYKFGSGESESLDAVGGGGSSPGSREYALATAAASSRRNGNASWIRRRRKACMDQPCPRLSVCPTVFRGVRLFNRDRARSPVRR